MKTQDTSSLHYNSCVLLLYKNIEINCIVQKYYRHALSGSAYESNTFSLEIYRSTAKKRESNFIYFSYVNTNTQR